MSRQQELKARWDAFLANISRRFEESLQQGTEAVLESLVDNDYDYYSSFRTMAAVKSQISDSLIHKINETWRIQVEPAMRSEGDYWIDESKKGYNLQDALHEKMAMWAFLTEGQLSQQYYDYAIRLVNKDFYCTQCHSPIAIQQGFFRAQYITCSYCNTVNTFEPETKYVQIGWNVVNNIAALRAQKEYLAMKQAEKETGATKHTHEEGMDKYKAAYRRYLERFFKERICLMPDMEASYEADIALAMKKNFTNTL